MSPDILLRYVLNGTVTQQLGFFFGEIIFLRSRADKNTAKKNEPGWIRTIDTRLKRAVLYQLSYGPISPSLSEYQNQRLIHRRGGSYRPAKTKIRGLGIRTSGLVKIPRSSSP